MRTVLPHKPGLQNFLKNFNILGNKPISRIISVKQVHEAGEVYFIAYIYDNFGDYVENIDILVAVNEEHLRRDLKEIYSIDYLSKRSFENFSAWFKKLHNRDLSEREIQSVKYKFKY